MNPGFEEILRKFKEGNINEAFSLTLENLDQLLSRVINNSEKRINKLEKIHGHLMQEPHDHEMKPPQVCPICHINFFSMKCPHSLHDALKEFAKPKDSEFPLPDQRIMQSIGHLEQRIAEIETPLKEEQSDKKCITCGDECDNINHPKKDFCCTCVPKKYITKPGIFWCCKKCEKRELRTHNPKDLQQIESLEEKLDWNKEEIERLKSELHKSQHTVDCYKQIEAEEKNGEEIIEKALEYRKGLGKTADEKELIKLTEILEGKS